MPEMSLDALRARIRALEGGGTGFARRCAMLGEPLDEALPWRGLPAGALHELRGPAAGALAAAFARRFLEHRGALVWIQDERDAARQGALYGPGLAAFGIAPGRLLVARCRSGREVLWSFEEALRCPGVACAVAEADRLDLLASRRLQLAAESGGGAGLVLGGDVESLSPCAALTRWRATPLPSPGGGLLLRLELRRIKGGAPAMWTVSWDERTLAFTVAAGLADRAGDAWRRAAGQAAGSR
ncbi:ImuA family protein [Marinimicrococcus flavescens]|uniref:Damage-inducible mutagenesis protein n=1 Tax=Marinimicrococcus flavescens TaxID=3031815 RepID=A0AAP3XQB5_9PROT|nr:hypothetical protein [Marinimicrococcus flavescens]